ncbi:MAG: DsbA family protein [Actinocrinis sp.]
MAQNLGPADTARQKAAAARREQVSANRRRRQLIVGAAVLSAIVALVAVGVAVQQKKASVDAAYGSGPVRAPAGAVGDGALAIPYGASAGAKVTLTVYEDFRCPYCRMAEGLFESAYRSYAQAGRIRVEYHLVDLIDHNLGGNGSLRAANAAACAQDAGAGRFEAYHDLLYANQPDENDDAYGSDAALLGLAAKVDGLDTAAFKTCLDSGAHASWVKKNYDALSTLLHGQVATPYYAIDGVQFQLDGRAPAAQQAAFKAALDAALARA